MAKAIISSILEGQLGKYVDGLRSDSLVVGLWSGELELRDLALKPHALAELQLPVAVASGSVSRVLVRVPWNQLGSASVTITLEGVSALVVPNTALPSNAELLQAKHNHMERRELLRQHRRFAARVVPGERTTDKNAKVEDEGTFVSRLTAKIVANLQVTLLDVHLRYEDVVANPETPFACGVMLERFRLFTTDGEGREAYVDQTTLHNAFTYKKAELTQFGVYWDRLNPKDPCARLEALEEVPRLMRSMVQNAEAETDQGADTRRRWLLRPCSLGVQLTKNESTDYSTVAKYVVEANLGELQGSLSREQYEDALFLQRAFLGRRAVEAHFALSRGRPLHTPGARPCEWWDYATRLVLEQRRAKLPRTAQNDKDKDVVTHTHRRRPHQRKMRWSSVHKALLEQQLYVEAFRAQLRNGGSLDPTTRQAKFKRRYEDIYPIDVVLVLRDAAEDAEDREREEAKASAPAKTQTTSNGGGSWYSYFFGSDSSASAPPAEEGEDPVLSAEGRENLREAYNDAVEKASRAHEVPMGCNLVAVDLQLANGSIALFQSNDHERPFMTAMLNGSLMLNIQPEDEWDAQFRVQHFDIFNGLAQDARFRSFCSPSRVSSPEGDSRLPCASIDLSRRAVVHSQIQTDDDVEARLKVRVRTEPVRVMVDPSFVMFLHAFFVSLLPEKQLEKVWQFATSSVADWMFPDDTGDERNKQESLGTAIISHERKEAEEAELMRSLERAQGRVEYDVLVDMDAPVLIVPDSVNDRADAVLVVDLGMLSFRNEEEVTMIDTALDVTLTTPDEDSRRLHWLLDVSNIHVLLGHQQQLVTWSDKELRGFAKIVEEVSVKFSVYTQASSSRLKLPLRDENKAAAKPLPQVGIYASVPVITVSLSEEQLVALGHIHSSVLVQAAIVAKENDQRLDYFEDQEQESKNESATAFDSIDADEASSVSIAVGEKFMLEVQLSLGCVELNLRESVVKDAFVVRALQTSFTLAAFSAHQKFQARLKALVMEDKLYSSESRFSKLICTGEGEGDIPHLIAIDVTSFAPETNSPEQQRFGGTASQVEVDVQFNVLHLQWNPSSVALFYRIVSAYASAIQSHEDDFPPVDSTAAQNPALETVKHQEVSRDEQTERAIALPSLSSRGRPFMTIRASLVQFSLTFNKDQLDRQLARLEMTDAAINFTNYDVEGRNSSSEDTFEVTGHIGNFVGMDLSTAKHPLYSMLIGLDEDEARRRKSACNSSEALLTFAFVSDPMASDKSSLRLAFQPVRGVYYHQQILELVDFLLEGVGGAIVSQTLMNATQMLLREDEASVVLDLTIEKPTLILPFSLEDSPHAKVTADVLRLEHFPASAVHYEGPPGARTKRVVHDEFLSRTMIQRADAEGGGISMRVDCKDIFLKQVRIYCTAAGAGKQMKGDSERPMYEELLSDPANLKISIEDLVSSTVSLGDEEETDGSDETRMVFLPRITVNSVLPPVEARLSRTAYLGIVALILENFGADELQNAPGAEDINRSNSVGRLLARKNSADTGDLPSLRPKVTYTYRQPDADVATLRMRFVMENARILLLQDVVAGQFPEEIASPESIVNRVLTTPAIDESLHNGAFAEVVASGFSLLFADEYDKNPCLTVTLNGFCARDLANKHKSAMGSVDSSKLLVSPRPLDICYTWDDAALTGDLDLLFSEVAVTVVPKALLALVDFFTLPSRPNSAAVHKSTRVKNLIAPANVVRTTSQPTSPSPSPSLLTRRESISDILRDGKEPETTITVRMNATQVGIAVPRDAYDPDTPRVAFTGDFGLEFKWKPRPDAEKANASGGDLEIQSSILADAQNMEVVLENAKRSGCCVASPSLNEQWDAIDVAPVIQLLEPCNLHVEVSDLFPHAGQRQQIVALSFSPIEVFVSYDDACMAIDTMQAIDEAFAQHESHHHAASLRYSPSVDSTVPSVLLRSRSSSKSIQEYGAAEEEEVHRYFTCELPSVSLTLINDCGGCDMGLAQLQVERSHLFLNVTYTIQHGDSDDLSASFVTSDFPISTRPMTTSISGGGSLVVVMAYYNPDTRDWHPMCAEWSIDASIQGSISHESELHVIVTASQPLDLTLTHGLLEVVASVGGAWKRRTALIVGTEQEDSKRLETAPCVIRNETGLPLGFWLTNGSFTTAPEVVSTGQLADLRYVHGVGRGRGVVRRYASADRATANLRLCLQLMHSKNTDGDVPRFQAVQGLIFEQLDDGRPFRILLRVVGSTEHTARPVRIEIMAEIWVINRSGLDLVYGTAADSEAYIPPRAARAQVGNAQISAYSSDSVTDRKHSGMSADDSQGLFAERAEDESELVARATLTRIGLEASWSPQATSAKVNLMGLKVEDLLPQSKNRVILRPLLHGDSLIPAARPGAVGVEKYFLEITYLERPHAKYTWVERVHVELQNVKIATSMTFVDRLTKLQRETIAHFQHTSLVAAFPGEEVSDIEDNEEENLLAYFVDQSHDEKGINSHDISAMTGRKMYIVSGEISPVRVIVSFTRDKSDANHRSSDGFWLSNLKLKIENACVALEGYRLSNALATQEALGGAIIRFYEHSVKSQAFSLIESIEVTSLVTSMVAGGVTTLVSTLRGKADPAAAVGATAPGIATPNVDDSSSDAAFRYEHMTNGEIIRKHSRAFSECHNSTEFLRQVRHLVYDWDANHTGLGARGCVALALINNSRHSLVVNTQLNDGASLRVLPLGRRHLASVLDSVPDGEAASAGGGGTTSWRADRALVVFAYGYTPTLLTSGDVYFTVQSNACSVYATRKTARLRANRGYTATFTLQETQSWWSTNVIIVGDDLQANDASPASSDPNSLFGEVPDPDDQSADMQDEDDEFEVQFSSSSLGIIAKQSGHSVIVRECVPSSAAHSSGRIAAGDCILAVNGTRVDNTSQFKTLVSKAPRPIVLRFRATGRHSNAAYDLFGEHKS
ncbi:hypothetical protein PHYBOEH_009018 [Phytophthora boehmeriae]|uniref:PDZ domain-containing protein n=1 Tax=Phytophthora boehmeriae TaxID=109152 RepID=A0A8T1VZX7_9STRA|nr:hypothetical protein PHYBOEH_009018 [Phytophthora boehmeriae]